METQAGASFLLWSFQQTSKDLHRWMWIHSGQNRGCFLLLLCDFEEYQVSLWPEKQTLFHLYTHTHTSLQTYLSLWECVCPKGLLKSGRVSMDWVKALLLKGLLRRVSSLDLGDDGAITEFWKTGEWHFKANLPTHTQKWHSGDFVWTG